MNTTVILGDPMSGKSILEQKIRDKNKTTYTIPWDYESYPAVNKLMQNVAKYPPEAAFVFDLISNINFVNMLLENQKHDYIFISSTLKVEDFKKIKCRIISVINQN
jgi:hypothetical protein